MFKIGINLVTLLIFIFGSVTNAQNNQPFDSYSVPRQNLALNGLIVPNFALCGCPDMINLAEANATDILNRQVAPKTAYERVNFTYLALFNVTTNRSLIYNMSELGDKLALLEYNMTITNKGNVNITEIEINDSLSGIYYLGNLTPDQTARANPRYTITKDQIRYCFINSSANITGIDRCCKLVYLPLSSSYSISLEQLDYVLHNYSTIIKDQANELEDGKHDIGDLMVFAGILRNQSIRVKDFEDLVREKWFYLPD